MADWLKVNHSLVRSPKLRGLMRALRCRKHAALGFAVSWLCWVDEQTVDGQTGLRPDELDDELGFRGGVEALIGIGWAALGGDGLVYALEFGKHCGVSAKERALNARRQSNRRALSRDVSRCERDVERDECNAEGVTRIEENRIEYMENTLSGNNTVDMVADAGRVPLPVDAEEVRALMAGTASCALDRRELVACATAFFEESTAVGWVLKGQPVRDWRAMARAFMARWQNNLRAGGGAVRSGRKGGAAGGGGNGLGELNRNVY